MSATVIRRSPDLVTRETPDAVVVLARAAGATPVTLRGSSAVIWQELGPERSEDELVARVARRYAREPAAIVDEVRRAVQTLADHQVVTIEP